jgi:hypothetical protein
MGLATYMYSLLASLKTKTICKSQRTDKNKKWRTETISKTWRNRKAKRAGIKKV